MNDPFNRLPIDGSFVQSIQEQTEAAAKALGCMVMLIAVQEGPGAKTAADIAGVPAEGPLHEMSKDLPRMLVTLASVVKMQELVNKVNVQ